MRAALARLFAAATSLLGDPKPTVHVVGDVYLDVIAKVDDLPGWDGDTAIRSPIETVAGGSALNTVVQPLGPWQYVHRTVSRGSTGLGLTLG